MKEDGELVGTQMEVCSIPAYTHIIHTIHTRKLHTRRFSHLCTHTPIYSHTHDTHISPCTLELILYTCILIHLYICFRPRSYVYTHRCIYIPILQPIHRIGYLVMHSCTHAQSRANRHRNTLRSRYKQSNPPTSTDPFMFVFMDPIPNTLYQYVADFLQWCVDKCKFPILHHMNPASFIQYKP